MDARSAIFQTSGPGRSQRRYKLAVPPANGNFVEEAMMTEERFVVCVNNDDYPVDLMLHKIYHVLPDAHADRIGWVRIVDESGEDYLYPGTYFHSIDVPALLRQELLRID